MDVILGVDIGGTYTKYGALNEKGQLCFQGSLPTRTHESFSGYGEAFFLEINDQLLAVNGRLKGIGVGSPMGNALNGHIEGAVNLQDIWGTNIPLVDAFSRLFKVPTYLMNDSNAAAMGEKYFGKAKPYHDFLVLTLGTGLGCGIFSQGSLLIGKNGAAGEVGHMTVEQGGRLCNCGREGCLETYVSATGLVRTTLELAEEMNQELDENLYRDAASIAVAAQRGDELAKKAFQITGSYSGRSLANLAVIFDPEAIILTGGLANAGHMLLDPVKCTFEKSVLSSLAGTVDIMISKSKGKNMAVLGAASFAREEMSSEMLQITHEI